MAKKKSLDMSKVKDRGDFNPRNVDEGDYKAKIVKVADHESDAGNDGWVFTIKLDKKSGSYPYYCMFTPESLWKIRNLMVAAGKKVPKKRVQVDPNSVVGKAIGVTMEDDEYDDKLKSIIVNVFPVDELDGDVDDDDEEEEDEDVQEDDEDEEEDDEEEEDEDDDEEEEEDYSDWSVKALRKECKDRGLKTTGKKAQLVKRLETDDEESEDVDEEEI